MVTCRKAVSEDGATRSNGEAGENHYSDEPYHQDNVTYGDIVLMKPVDKSNVNNDPQEQPNVIYSELTLNRK